jgi:uncharacterized protein with HEPN domain
VTVHSRAENRAQTVMSISWSTSTRNPYAVVRNLEVIGGSPVCHVLIHEYFGIDVESAPMNYRKSSSTTAAR